MSRNEAEALHEMNHKKRCSRRFYKDISHTFVQLKT